MEKAYVRTLIFVAFASTLLAARANAAVTYTYEGERLLHHTLGINAPYEYDGTTRLTGFMKFSTPLSASTSYGFDATANLIDFEFFDGRQILSLANGGYPVTFQIATDDAGNISSNWVIAFWKGDATNKWNGRSFVVTYNAISNTDGLRQEGDVVGITPAFPNGDCMSLPAANCYFDTTWASNSTSGKWTLQPVPLPSNIGLMVFSIGCLWTCRIKRVRLNC